jgi:hypothetical protein
MSVLEIHSVFRNSNKVINFEGYTASLRLPHESIQLCNGANRNSEREGFDCCLENVMIDTVLFWLLL